MSPGNREDAFRAEIEHLFLAESAALFHRAMRLAQGRRDVAEDLVQEAFRAAALTWPDLRGRSMQGRRAWLFAVLRNKAVDRWRAESKVRPDPGLTDGCLAGAHTGEPERAAIAKIALDRCWKMIETMPPAQHRIAYLRWHEGWTPREIADCLGITQDTVRGHLMRARHLLMREVGPEVPFFAQAEPHPGGSEREEGTPA